MNKTYLIYNCKKCGKKIHWQTALYGKGRCRSCNSKLKKGKKNNNYKYGKYSDNLNKCIDCNIKISPNANRCLKCYGISKRGKNLPKCIDCGKIKKSYYGKRCSNCHNKRPKNRSSITGKKNHSYLHGKYCKNRINKCEDCGKKITALSKRCIKCNGKTHRGRNSPRFAKSPPPRKNKRFYYKNIMMRSSWEIAYAKYLDKNNIKWLYEPKRFYLKNCSYLPDFYLLKHNKYIEIKAYMDKKSQEKITAIKREYPNLKLAILKKKELTKLGVIK